MANDARFEKCNEWKVRRREKKRRMGNNRVVAKYRVGMVVAALKLGLGYKKWQSRAQIARKVEV